MLSGSDLKRLRYSTYLEILYPDEFLAKQPWPEDGQQVNLLGDILREYPFMQNISIPILQLSHITHNREADQIVQEEYYKFKANQKVGKISFFSEDRLTYRKVEDAYCCIQDTEDVFPGYLSWWGISSNQWYGTDASREVKEAVDTLKGRRVYAVEYLDRPPKSRYGNNAFLISLNNIMSSYKTSRSVDRPVENIYLKKGGTLRYKNEICYVIVVCVDGDDLGMPPIDGSDIFIGNGYIDENGTVLSTEEDAEVPCFKVEHAITFVPGEGYFSWDSLAFAFYFPKKGEYIECAKEHIERVDDLQHQESYCILRKQCPNGN